MIAETHAPDEVYEEVLRHFTEAETAKLSVLIIAINGWNRLAIAPRPLRPDRSFATGLDRTALSQAQVVWDTVMSMELDHTIVVARDRKASGQVISVDGGVTMRP